MGMVYSRNHTIQLMPGGLQYSLRSNKGKVNFFYTCRSSIFYVFARFVNVFNSSSQLRRMGGWFRHVGNKHLLLVNRKKDHQTHESEESTPHKSMLLTPRPISTQQTLLIWVLQVHFAQSQSTNVPKYVTKDKGAFNSRRLQKSFVLQATNKK
mmetsp:Transcript_33799/g.54270  ORF Transcript_33799/g.54270 Transcript_33799/m.54270 type:complete len:153 (-) Transcript_33799:351-809(-)